MWLQSCKWNVLGFPQQSGEFLAAAGLWQSSVRGEFSSFLFLWLWLLVLGIGKLGGVYSEEAGVGAVICTQVKVD